jgi:hypothetical protein
MLAKIFQFFTAQISQKLGRCIHVLVRSVYRGKVLALKTARRFLAAIYQAALFCSFAVVFHLW